MEKVKLDVPKLDIIYSIIQVKQRFQLNNQSFLLKDTRSGESMNYKLISKVKKNFLYWQNKYLTPNIRLLFCNVLIQPHFDDACSVRYPNLSKNLKHEIRALQNKSNRVCVH